MEKNSLHWSNIVDPGCASCPRDIDEYAGIQRPTKETFDKYLNYFLNDVPDPNCAKAGKAAYSSVRRSMFNYYDRSNGISIQ